MKSDAEPFLRGGGGPGPRVLIDACVLFPTVMREIVLGCAAAGLFTPLWSEWILREWAGAAARRSPGDETVAKGEIALCRAKWPTASIAWPPAMEGRFHLPDRDDRHVLAAAVAGNCSVLMTMNLRDFPRATLADHQIAPAHPDQFLRGLLDRAPAPVTAVVVAVRDQAQELSGQQWPLRKLLKKARLPRLGKALEHLG